jgi:hypothetical protein
MTRLTKLKGYKVSKTKSGKTILEPIPCYGKSVSARIANRKKTKVSKRAPT